ncbi:MAG: ketoacyl-ACP synthase III, partial [Phycisphaerales bacterium]|nr:ketoacyl-ACP synthase III [Phycisphaerales bacterium]
TLAVPDIGVRVCGTGSQAPSKVMTNADLEKVMDTSDEWIVQRTGIRERRLATRENGESTLTMATSALRKALDHARMSADELDLVILATMTPEMPCPASSNRLVAAIGAGNAGGFDVSAACCSFVFALNSAYALLRTGLYRTIGLVGADTLSKFMNYDDDGRSTAILFGDGAGAAILKVTDDTSKGLLAQQMHSDGERWSDLYIPMIAADRREEEPDARLGTLQMNGRSVFRFAVSTFQELIADTLDDAGLTPDDIDHYVCHQSNARILGAARERFGIPEEKMCVNIDRYGNTVSASVPLVFDELMQQGRIKDGQRVMFVAFGGGLTWGSSLWQL